MRISGCIVCMEEITNAYKILVCKSEGKYDMEIRWVGVGWTPLVPDTDQWWWGSCEHSNWPSGFIKATQLKNHTNQIDKLLSGTCHAVTHVSNTGSFKSVYFAYFNSIMKYGIVCGGNLSYSKKIIRFTRENYWIFNGWCQT